MASSNAIVETADGAGEQKLTLSQAAAPGLVPMSLTPGRVRWEVRGMRGQPGLAQRLERALRADARIQSADASPMSGRLLVYYDDALPFSDLEAVVEEAAGALFPWKIATPRGDFRGNAAAGESLPALVSGGALIAIGREFARFLATRLAHDPAAVDEDLALLAELMEPHVARFRMALCGSVATNVLGVARIVPISVAMNVVAYGTVPSVLGVSLGPTGTVAVMVALAIGGALLRGRLRLRTQLLWNGASRDLQHGLRMKVWERVQRLDAAFLEDTGQSTALTILSEDINQCERAFDSAYTLIDVGFNTLMFSTALLSYSLTLGGWAILPIPALVALSLAMHPKVQATFARVGAESARLAANVVDSVGGITTIRAFSGEAGERDRIGDASDSYRSTSTQSQAAVVALPLALEATILVGQIGIYLLNSRRIAMGHTVGELSVVNTASGHLLFPLTALGPLIENMEKGLSAFDRVRKFLASSPVEDESGDALTASDISGAIRYRDIQFAYPSRPNIFDGLSLTIPPRSWSGVVGQTGSGKSSLIKLLLRFHRPQDGEIELDGRDIQSLRATDLRRAISIVSQDIYLFQRSIFDNIAIGRPGATRDEVAAAARNAQAHDFITQLPNGYDTILGERGHTLSGGERQRLAIARALLKDAPILIFDEATSSLDSNTEMDVQAALRPLFAGRTVITIAHRLSTVRHADRIFVLEQGRLVQEGTHSALVRQRGHYRQLWNSQLGIEQSAGPG